MDEIEYLENSDSEVGSIIDYDDIKSYSVKNAKIKNNKYNDLIKDDIYEYFDQIYNETMDSNILNIYNSLHSDIDTIFLEMIFFHLRNNKK